MTDIHDILRRNWGYSAFRPLQEDIIKTVIEGKDCFALLPTGGGKSICYQVPALAQDGICLVISPLIALMKDQVENLKKKGVLAAAIFSGMSRREIVQTLKNVAHGPYKLLYVSPERLETSLFLEYLPAMNVNLIAVDEAHCISQWGYDFRPSYLRISALREELPGVPVLALTASATPEVQKDICEKLKLQEPGIFCQPFTRPNLSYSAFDAESKLFRLREIISKVPGSGIVYCKSRRRTVEIAEMLRMHGIAAEHYHAGLQQSERNERQQNWIDDKTRIIVCTNAFGMGIDKPSVRIVVHADIPDCLESYYQEAGRAGRDGKKSYAVLLYTKKDLEDLGKSHEKQYPSFEEIKKVYCALVNYLQLPTYTGDEQSFDFDFSSFIKNFKLDSYTALHAFRAMAQDGWFDVNEIGFSASTIMITSDRDELSGYQSSQPDADLLLTTLLRTYGGLFDMPVIISESLIAQLTKQSSEKIIADLKQLHAHGILEYQQKTDKPKIRFLKHRVNVEDFHIDLKDFTLRKNSFIERAGKMASYATTSTCRSLYINNYFGDADHTPCGNCDNCLAAKKKTLTTDEFAAIHSRIIEVLGDQKLPVKDVLHQLKQFEKHKTWEVVRFLQSENMISTDERGYLYKVKGK